MKVVIASDHGGINLKKAVTEYLTDKQIEFTDLGPDSTDSVDYPDYAKPVAEKVAAGEFDKGILICGTGIGMSITANKTKGIRLSLIHI